MLKTKTKAKAYYCGSVESFHYNTGTATKLTDSQHEKLLARPHNFPNVDGNWLFQFDDPGWDDLLCHEDELEFL